MRVLSSLGTAPRTLLTANVATDMHPDHGGAGILPVAPPTRIDIDEAASLASFASASQDSQAAGDAFGWAPDLLACVVRYKHPGSAHRGPADVFARLKHIIAVADVPDAVAASAKAAMATVLPVQLGLGVKGGPERLAWTAQTVLAQGGVVDTDDVVNAFNTIKRKSVLDAVAVRWPDGTQLYNK